MIADEPVASLDVSIQAQIINLFKHLQEEHGFSIVFIAHDLSMVEFLCDRVTVMYHWEGSLSLADTKSDFMKSPLQSIYEGSFVSDSYSRDPILERKKVRPGLFKDRL